MALASIRRTGVTGPASPWKLLQVDRQFRGVTTAYPAFLPKVISDFHLTQPIELRSLFCPQVGKEGDPRGSWICPVRKLTEYISRTRAHRKAERLYPFRVRPPGWPLVEVKSLTLGGRDHPHIVQVVGCAYSSGDSGALNSRCGGLMGLVVGRLPCKGLRSRHMVGSLHLPQIIVKLKDLNS